MLKILLKPKSNPQLLPQAIPLFLITGRPMRLDGFGLKHYKSLEGWIRGLRSPGFCEKPTRGGS